MSSVARENAEAPLILSLDVGSSSVRASLYDSHAHPVEGLEAQIKYQLDTTPEGGVEKDPDELLKLLGQAIDSVLEAAGPLASQIKGVAMDTFWHGLLGLDEDGNPETPLISWADTRSAQAAEQLRRELDEKAVHSRTGCLFHASYFPAKLRWLASTQPVIYRRVKRWVSFGEYFYLKLFGQTRVSVSMASATGLFNQNGVDWDKELLEALKLSPEQFSPLGDLDTPQHGLNPEYAQRWPTLREVPWFPAVGDGAANNLGAGCFSPERIAIMVGTSSAMRVVWASEKIEIPWGLWCYRADKNRFVLGGALSEGGNLFAWMRETLKLPELTEVERELSTMEPAGHGLTMLPFLSGERSPGWASHARAAITGLSLNTSALEILRAGLEAIAFRFGLMYELLQPVVPQAREIIASGGALLNSPAWMQIIADVLNRPVIASGEGETSSRGATLLALEQLKVLGDGKGLEYATYDFGQTYAPDSSRHARYMEALEEQRELYKLLIKKR